MFRLSLQCRAFVIAEHDIGVYQCGSYVLVAILSVHSTPSRHMTILNWGTKLDYAMLIETHHRQCHQDYIGSLHCKQVLKSHRLTDE